MEKIILIPPTHEQTTPSFHVEGSLAEQFIGFLKSRGIEAWQPPEKLDTRGADTRRIIEIEIEAGTEMSFLENLRREFLDKPKID